MGKVINIIGIFSLLTATVANAGTIDSVQRMLNQLGYNAGAVDGAYGKKTRGALEAFYADTGGSYDGKLDVNEVADLRTALIERGLTPFRVPKINLDNKGRHYSAEYMINGKYALPLKSLTSSLNGARGPDSHEYRQRLNSFMNNFYALGDFNNDGIQDVVVTAFRAEENEVAYDGGGASVFVDKVSKYRSFKVYAGDTRTGWANDYYRKGGEDITHLFIEDPKLAGIADHQMENQKPLIADFNGDGIDDMYISSSTRTERSERNDGQFFGGWHSYYLSQPDGTFKESSREMMKGKWVERSTGRYTEFAHRSDIGDIDGDGDIDIVHTSVTWNGGDRGNGYVICMFNDGSGRLTSKTCGDQWGNQVKIGDFNGDGNADILVMGAMYNCRKQHGIGRHISPKRNNARINFGNGSGKFYNRQGKNFVDNLGYHQMANGEKILVCGMPTALVMDVDNDGDQDIVGNTIGESYVGGYFQVFLNDGVGNFSLGQQIVNTQPNVHYGLNNWAQHEGQHGSTGYCFNMHSIDLNNDGYMDFWCDGHFFSEYDGRILINQGDGTFKDAPKWLINKHATVY